MYRTVDQSMSARWLTPQHHVYVVDARGDRHMSWSAFVEEYFAGNYAAASSTLESRYPDVVLHAVVEGELLPVEF